MWPYLRKSNINNNNNDEDCSPKSRRAPSSPNFKRRSFKDIDLLTHGDDNMPNFTTIDDEASSSSSSSSSSQNRSVTGSNDVVKRPCVFHRVHLANRFTRAFSGRPKPEENESAEPSRTDDSTSEKPANSNQFDSQITNPQQKPTYPNQIEPQITNHEPKLKQFEKRITIPGSEKRVVVYMTSLRAVRPTFEACRTVRSILQGFRVPVDERDLLMDSSFFDEIRKIMAQIGEGTINDRRVSLPRVFIGGRYIGGADEIVELHEIGELKKFVSGLPAVKAGVCEICGGFRFCLCDECNGSHKCPLDDGGFRVCSVCNENGLVRCPSCLST
ncbi:hypothetical protein QVD17_17487 [Tagetes erecta]|uniref:Glutaredoxin domain-containing protein n=1 Tax=Tagetes erecta TaxID=13708 RepID=A0AAD8KW51_TARER|nr:hypothetical protein QVD17_17487 [Tagetes erecta]